MGSPGMRYFSGLRIMDAPPAKFNETSGNITPMLFMEKKEKISYDVRINKKIKIIKKINKYQDVP